MRVVGQLSREHRALIRGIQAREQLLRQALAELDADRELTLESVAQAHGLPREALGVSYRLDAQAGVIILEEGRDADHDPPADPGTR